jgi:hypothetical protein
LFVVVASGKVTGSAVVGQVIGQGVGAGVVEHGSHDEVPVEEVVGSEGQVIGSGHVNGVSVVGQEIGSGQVTGEKSVDPVPGWSEGQGEGVGSVSGQVVGNSVVMHGGQLSANY